MSDLELFKDSIRYDYALMRESLGKVPNSPVVSWITAKTMPFFPRIGPDGVCRQCNRNAMKPHQGTPLEKRMLDELVGSVCNSCLWAEIVAPLINSVVQREVHRLLGHIGL